MSAPPLVRAARRDEAGAVARILTDSFADEAGLNFWLRQGAMKTFARSVFCRAAVRDLLHKDRELWIAESDADKVGAAIWLKPGDAAFQFSPALERIAGPLFYVMAGAEGSKRGEQLGAQLEALSPQEPHTHLMFLGVSPRAQGRGVGSAMLKQMLAPLDRAGAPAYLECSTPRNVALYERHGFAVSGQFELPGLPMWTMTRPVGG